MSGVGRVLTHLSQFIDVHYLRSAGPAPRANRGNNLRGEAKKSYLRDTESPVETLQVTRNLHGKQDVLACDAHPISHTYRPARLDVPQVDLFHDW